MRSVRPPENDNDHRAEDQNSDTPHLQPRKADLVPLKSKTRKRLHAHFFTRMKKAQFTRFRPALNEFIRSNWQNRKPPSGEPLCCDCIRAGLLGPVEHRSVPVHCVCTFLKTTQQTADHAYNDSYKERHKPRPHSHVWQKPFQDCSKNSNRNLPCDHAQYESNQTVKCFSH